MRLLRTNELIRRTGLSRSTLWRLERDGKFPKRRQIGAGAVGWLEHEIDEWIEKRPVIVGANINQKCSRGAGNR